MDLQLLSRSNKDKALEIGFSKIGLTEAKFYKQDQDNLEQWLSNGFHGSMDWIERRKLAFMSTGCRSLYICDD